jgi:hypothetical protein
MFLSAELCIRQLDLTYTPGEVPAEKEGQAVLPQICKKRAQIG